MGRAAPKMKLFLELTTTFLTAFSARPRMHGLFLFGCGPNELGKDSTWRAQTDSQIGRHHIMSARQSRM